MKKIWDFVQTGLGLALLIALVLGLGAAFQALGRGPTADGSAATPDVPADGQGYPPPVTREPGVDGQGYPPPAPTAMVDMTQLMTDDFGTPIPMATLPPLQDVPESYDPKTYGLPDEIAGYPVLAVITSENQYCMRPGTKSVLLQVPTVIVDDHEELVPTTNLDDALVALGLDLNEWRVSLIGGYMSREEIIRLVQEGNKNVQQSGCVQGGGPVPTEDPLAHP